MSLFSAGLLVLSWLGSCDSFDGTHGSICLPCEDKCPDGLVCRNDWCVPEDDERGCPEGLDEATTSGVTTGPSMASGGGGSQPGTDAGVTSKGDGAPANGNGGVATDGGGSGGEAGGPPLEKGSEAGTTGGCSDCQPQMVTPAALSPVCAGSPVHIQLEAECTCDEAEGSRRMYWEMTEVSGLSLSSRGILSGALAAGEYSLHVTVDVDHSWEVEGTFQLTVSHCEVFYLSDEPTALPHVALGNLDTGAVAHISPAQGELAQVSEFDVSPDGNFLAQVEVLADTKLRLYRVTAAGVEAVDWLHTGDHVEHAFSGDSRWLALVTTNPGEEGLSLLQLVDLTATPVSLVNAAPLKHRAGLAWSDVGSLLTIGPYSDDEPFMDVIQESPVTSDGIGDAIRLNDGKMTNESFERFLVSDQGFLAITTTNLRFYNRETGMQFPPWPDALSPKLTWVATETDAGVNIDKLHGPFHEGEPHASYPGCETIHAWSADDSTFVCTDHGSLFVQESDRAGKFTGVPLGLNFPGASLRLALSERGTWLAVTPNNEGLAVVLTDGSGINTTLTGPEGTNEWDFFFTPSESRVIVQQGQRLAVAMLDRTHEPVFDWVEEVTLAAVPLCEPFWDIDSNTWCGSPHFDGGNLVLSPAETHVAFVDEYGIVTGVNLETLDPTSLGPISGLCAEDCSQISGPCVEDCVQFR